MVIYGYKDAVRTYFTDRGRDGEAITAHRGEALAVEYATGKVLKAGGFEEVAEWTDDLQQETGITTMLVHGAF